MLCLLLVCGVLAVGEGLDNGLALTPPMGWLSGNRFQCITDCIKYPNECISENLVKRTADLLESEGYRDAGYEYLVIDDCWLDKKRGPDGRLMPDRKRFPNGMRAVSDYVTKCRLVEVEYSKHFRLFQLHSKELKLGLYEVYGRYTGFKYPGILGNEALDIQTLANWEIDYLKLASWQINPKEMDTNRDMFSVYPAVGKLLNDTGRPILYACSWAAHQESIGMHPDYASLTKHCNMWRNWKNIEDTWSSIKSIITWFGDNQERFTNHAGPGHWNDPDMLLIGNNGLSVDQAKVQMALWAILAAPLLISTDLATIKSEFKEILLNQDVIAVNQDPLGKQGMRVWKMAGEGTRSDVEIWNRELQDGSYAIAFVNMREGTGPLAANFTYKEIGLPLRRYYIAEDLYREENIRLWVPKGAFEVLINPTGVKFYLFYEVAKSSEKIFTSQNVYDTDNATRSVPGPTVGPGMHVV